MPSVHLAKTTDLIFVLCTANGARGKQLQSVQMSDSSSSHTNDRYLNTPEKMKVDLKKRVHAAEASVKQLKDKRKLTEDHGDTIDSELHFDLLGIMHTNDEQIKRTYPEGRFSRLFWE